MKIIQVEHPVVKINRFLDDIALYKPDAPIEPLKVEETILTLYPPEGCTLGMEIFEGTLYVYRTPHTEPTALDHLRYAALMGMGEGK